jgi:hypothetical protein
MRFKFAQVVDDTGVPNDRPVFPLRLASDHSGRPPYCLLDTGALDTFMRREFADEAGVDLTDAEAVGPFRLGTTVVTGLAKTVGCVIEDGTGAAISLKDVRVTFLSSWPYPGFGAILGTIAMKQFLVTVSAGQGWIEILEAGTGSGPGNARPTQLSQMAPAR